MILILIFIADQQINFLLSLSNYFISGNEKVPSGSPLEWYYIGGPVAAVVFLLALILYVKKRRTTGKMLPYENKMSSFGRLWHFLRQRFGVGKSYLKQVIFCISSTDFEGPSTVPSKPLTNQFTKRLNYIRLNHHDNPPYSFSRCLKTESNVSYTWFLSVKFSLR